MFISTESCSQFCLQVISASHCISTQPTQSLWSFHSLQVTQQQPACSCRTRPLSFHFLISFHVMENYPSVRPSQSKSAVKMEGKILSSKYSHRPWGTTVTAFLEKLIINRSREYKWKLDTTAHMVKRWTNQFNVGAQMEQMGWLPRTTGIQPRNFLTLTPSPYLCLCQKYIYKSCSEWRAWMSETISPIHPTVHWFDTSLCID